VVLQESVGGEGSGRGIKTERRGEQAALVVVVVVVEEVEEVVWLWRYRRMHVGGQASAKVATCLPLAWAGEAGSTTGPWRGVYFSCAGGE
jgi:hypothetical protein